MRFILGLFAFLSSLGLLLMVGYQHDARDFSGVQTVESARLVDGPVIIQGQVEKTGGVMCPESERECLYVKTEPEMFVRTESIVCNELPDDVEMIEQVEDRCDGSTGVCEPCYRVASYAWELQEDQVTEQFSVFTVEAYQVVPNAETNFLDEQTIEPEESLDPAEGDTRVGYTFAETSDTLLVAGEAIDGGITTQTEEGVWLISSSDYETVMSTLQTQDKNARNGLRVGSLMMMMLAFVLVTSQVSSPILGVFKIVPGLGGFMERGSKMAVTIVAALAGALLWGVIFFPLSLIVF